jgi:hypothetical protein
MGAPMTVPTSGYQQEVEAAAKAEEDEKIRSEFERFLSEFSRPPLPDDISIPENLDNDDDSGISNVSDDEVADNLESPDSSGSLDRLDSDLSESPRSGADHDDSESRKGEEASTLTKPPESPSPSDDTYSPEGSDPEDSDSDGRPDYFDNSGEERGHGLY